MSGKNPAMRVRDFSQCWGLGTVQLKSQKSMDIGLLGQDFFEGYNYTIKQNVIEFHRQEP